MSDTNSTATVADVSYDSADAKERRETRAMFRSAALAGIQDVLSGLGAIQKSLSVIRKEQRLHLSHSQRWLELEALAEKKRGEMDVLHSQAQAFTDSLKRMGEEGL